MLRFSRSPRVLLFVQGFIEVVKDLPRSHAPQCRSLDRLKKVEGLKPEEEKDRQKINHV